jgi:mono/diheme cytochrome c family protein
MKRLIWVLVVIVLVGCVVTWRAFSMSVPHHPDVPVTADMVKRGEYLVQAGDCISCHTVPGRPAFSGGREFDLGDKGKLYSPNITPDKETGIGGWSDDDFRAALQLGVAKGGEHLYPAFPYASFTLLSDDDILAIKAYLGTVRPVHYNPPDNAMKFPYDKRFLMAYWSWLFNPNARFTPDAGQSAEWNRGKFLVEGLGHCGDCHTTRNMLQAVDRSKAYGGAITQKWKAYNISSDKETGIGNWTDEALVSYLSTGFAEAHGPASGPMAEVISNSLQFLTKEDIHAIVTYLRSLKPIPSVVPVSAPASQATAEANADHGREVYARECNNCHHLSGDGNQSPYEALHGSRSMTDPEGVNITQIVLYGSSMNTPNGHVSMPGFGKGVSDTDVAALVNFVTGQWSGHSANLSPEEVAARR